jgi:hypothetical protein
MTLDDGYFARRVANLKARSDNIPSLVSSGDKVQDL